MHLIQQHNQKLTYGNVFSPLLFAFIELKKNNDQKKNIYNPTEYYDMPITDWIV